MSSALNFTHRTCLRIAGGKPRWHQRFYRPSVNVVRSATKLVFEEDGFVFEAYPLEVLHQQFSGRLNILLAGPSAKALEDKSLLLKHPLMCVSGSPQLLGEETPPIAIYHVNDATFIRDRLELFLKFSNAAEWTVIDYRVMFELLKVAPERLSRKTKFVVFDNWAYPLHLPLGEIQKLMQPPENLGIYCSNDLSLGLATAGTVAYTGGQVAWLSGFESAYYYGMDLTNSGHAYDDKNPRIQALDKAYEDFILPGFTLLAREAEATGFKFYNCNPESRLPNAIFQHLNTQASLM
jgi:hypothetical protein